MGADHRQRLAHISLSLSTFILTFIFAAVMIAFTIRQLFLNRKKSQRNTGNFPRLSLGLTLVCISWMVLTVPRLITHLQDFVTAAKLSEDDGQVTVMDVRGWELNSNALRSRLVRLITLYVWYSFGSVNVLILLIVVKKVREPGQNVWLAVKNKLVRKQGV